MESRDPCTAINNATFVRHPALVRGKKVNHAPENQFAYSEGSHGGALCSAAGGRDLSGSFPDAGGGKKRRAAKQTEVFQRHHE